MKLFFNDNYQIENQIRLVFITKFPQLKSRILNHFYKYSTKPTSYNFEKVIFYFLKDTKVFNHVEIKGPYNPYYDILIDNFYKIDLKSTIRNIFLTKHLFIKTFLVGIYTTSQIKIYLLTPLIQQKYLTNFKNFGFTKYLMFEFTPKITSTLKPISVINFKLFI
ncbi:hypothetical protein [Candidatus Phytoplasma pyri]|uniref:hypothetical protein n=1 Tax=Candidatus Phytoplasma pyri TaxID=47566 RepID=UPI0039833C27